MEEEITIGKTTYISAKRAAHYTGYAQDYVSQLARSGTLPSRKIGRAWFVEKKSIVKYKEELSVDGKKYLSTARAASVTGYTSDYIGQLARAKKVKSVVVGGGRYICADELIAYSQRGRKSHLLRANESEEYRKTHTVQRRDPPVVTGQMSSRHRANATQSDRVNVNTVVRKVMSACVAVVVVLGIVFLGGVVPARIQSPAAVFFWNNDRSEFFTGRDVLDRSALFVYDRINSLFRKGMGTEFTYPPPHIADVPSQETPTETKRERVIYVQGPEKIVEKIVERVPVVNVVNASDITREEIEQKFLALNDKLDAEIYRVSEGEEKSLNTVYRVISRTNKIDQLNGVSLSNVSFSGSVSGLTDAHIPNDITADNYLLLSGGTLSGALSGTTLSLSGTLSVTASTTFNGVEYLFPTADGSNGQVLATNGAGGLSWTSVAASDNNWTFFNGSGIRPATSTNTVLIGATATTSSNILEVIGGGYFSSSLGVGTTTPYAPLSVVGEVVASHFTATTTATSTLSGGLDVLSINQTGTATSTFAQGIDLSAGCFSVSGTCLDPGASSTFLGLTDTQSNFVANEILHVNASGNAATSTTGFVFDGSNLGIGTTSPYASLSIVGEAVASHFTATLTTAVSSLQQLLVNSSTTLQAFTGTNATTTNATTTNLAVSGSSQLGTVISGAWQGTAVATAYGGTGQDFSASTGLIYLSSGTASASSTLRDFVLDDALTISGGTINNTPIGATIPSAAVFTLATSTSATSTNFAISSLTSGSIPFATTGGALIDDNTNLFWDDTNNRLGIADNTPTFILDVTGNARFTSLVDASHFVATSTTATSTFAGGLTVDTSDFVVDPDGGRVGIGTTSPWANLSVDHAAGETAFAVGSSTETVFQVTPDGTVRTGGELTTNNPSVIKWSAIDDIAGNNAFAFGTSDTGASTLVRNIFLHSGTDNVMSGAAIVEAGKDQEWTGTASTRDGYLAIRTRENNGTNEVLRVTSNQRLGVGTTSPFAKLSVDHAAGEAAFAIGSSTGTTLLIDSNGDIGAGTSTPQDELHVYRENISTTVRIESLNGNNAATRFKASGGRDWLVGLTNTSDQFTVNDINTAGGVEFLIDTGGNVGIATNTPFANLSVDHSAGETAFAVGSSTNTSFIVDSNGNVGIGTSTPDQSLVIHKNSADLNPQITLESVGGSIPASWGIQVNRNTGRFTIRSLDNSQSPIKVYPESGDNEIIVSGTGVGLNDTAPDAALDIASSTATTLFRVDDSGDGDTSPFIIDGDGSVGIGTAAPDQLVHIASTSQEAIIRLENTATILGSTDDIGIIEFESQDVSENAAGIRAQIKASADSSGLGGTKLSFFTTQDAATALNEAASLNKSGQLTLRSFPSVGSDGLCWDGSAESLVGDCTSLQEFKTNIQDLTIGLDEVLRLRPRTFGWVDGMGSDRDLGFIAEEVQLVDPLLATYREGELRGVKYSRMVAVLVNAIQELVETIGGLEDRIAALEQRLNSLGSGVAGAMGSAFDMNNVLSAFAAIGAVFEDGVARFGTLVSNNFTVVNVIGEDSSVGSGTIPVGSVEVTVTNSLIDTNSKIFISFLSSLLGESWFIAHKQPGSFTLEISAPLPYDAHFDYWILSVEEVEGHESGPDSITDNSNEENHENTDTQPPVITINGNNPAVIEVGSVYSDLGVLVTDNVNDNLGYSVMVNDEEMSEVTIDTSQTGVHEILYSAVDQAGNRARIIREVIVFDAAITGELPEQSDDTIPTEVYILDTPPEDGETPSDIPEKPPQEENVETISENNEENESVSDEALTTPQEEIELDVPPSPAPQTDSAPEETGEISEADSVSTP